MHFQVLVSAIIKHSFKTTCEKLIRWKGKLKNEYLALLVPLQANLNSWLQEYNYYSWAPWTRPSNFPLWGEPRIQPEKTRTHLVCQPSMNLEKKIYYWPHWASPTLSLSEGVEQRKNREKHRTLQSQHKSSPTIRGISLSSLYPLYINKPKNLHNLYLMVKICRKHLSFTFPIRWMWHNPWP